LKPHCTSLISVADGKGVQSYFFMQVHASWQYRHNFRSSGLKICTLLGLLVQYV